MFRHSTKQNVRSQDWLQKKALAALDKDRQILCESVYCQSYSVPLPSPSVDMLNNVIRPMTGCYSEVDPERRRVYICVSLLYDRGEHVKVCFLQPEVSSSTATCKSSYSTLLNSVRPEVCKKLNNAAPGRVSVSTEKCQIAGRLAPYVVERSGLSSHVQWTYYNASKSRLFYVTSSVEGVRLSFPTRETLEIYQAFCVKDCAMVYSATTKCFKVTASPDQSDSSTSANKSTCIFLYCDGSFKVLGTPSRSYRVCELFRKTLIAAHTSFMHSRILSSAEGVEDAPSH